MMDRIKLVENILTFIPSVFKRLMKAYPNLEITRQQLGLLFHINCENGKPMSYYSEKMMIPKSNLTVLSDKLIKEGLAERAFDLGDRRVITLKITKKGREFLYEHKEKVKHEILKKLDSLSDADVKRLNELIEEIREIFDKIE
ncbi:MAG: MarR family winged helix-turn-helix transcriptional regulator [Caulobacteraceae bacterium]